MKGLLIIACAFVLLATGCTTAGKATRYFDRNTDTAAGYCATRYPVKTDSITEVRVDTVMYNEFIDNTLKYSDSLLKAAQGRYDGDKMALLIQVKELKEKGDYSESIAQQLADEINKMHPPDTSGLRASIEVQIRATLKPCTDSIIRIKLENTARVAAERARADKYQGSAELYNNGLKDPATVFGWLFTALSRKWWFWIGILAIIAFATRKLWLKLLL